MLLQIALYLFSFVAIWLGAGLAIQSVERLSKKLKLSSFGMSFLILGFFTSISELSVGVNSVLENDPEIYVGNLIGATIVIFMLIIPLLAVTGGKLVISDEFRDHNLLLSLIVIALPTLLSVDGKVTLIDSVIIVLAYIILVISIQLKNGFFEKMIHLNHLSYPAIFKEFFKILLGIFVIFIASRFVVEETLYFSQLLHISPFLISLILISLGTNIPELSFVIRSLFMKSNQVAFGDYVGSATFNSFLFGMLTLWYGQSIDLNGSYLSSLLFLVFGLVIFYLCAKSRNFISRFEGGVLITFYILFLITEVIIAQIFG